jgi:hypothetical protein
MRPSVREYVEAAKLARHRAQSERNPHAKQILQEIERSYYRLVEIEMWMVDQQQYNRPFCSFRVVRRTIKLGGGLDRDARYLAGVEDLQVGKATT